MQRLITLLLIFGFVSLCLCVRPIGGQNTFFNVIDYGARGDGKCDDSQAFLSAWQDTCGTQGTPTLVIPSGRIFLVRNIKLNGTCMATSIHIQLQGTIVAPAKDAWVGDNSTWILISQVNGLIINGTGGLINGYGSTWWECPNCLRPVAIRFKSCKDLNVSHLSITNSPQAHIRMNNCVGAIFSHINICSPGHSPNTDGIGISSSKNISIEDSIIKSGDDCIAIVGDSSYINVTGIACGPGHGISIGSLGKPKVCNSVEEVYVRNCNFTNTSNGARIKTRPGGLGYAKRITFEEITLIQNGAINVSDVTYRGFRGTSADGRAIILNCDPIGCSNIALDNVTIVSSQPTMPAYCFCSYVDGTATSTIPKCYGLR
ncbi:putative polygalacturonase, partial [Mucuna pruriens]